MKKTVICAAIAASFLSTFAVAGESGLGERDADRKRLEEAERRLQADRERRASIERDERRKPRVTIGGEINTRYYSRSGSYDGPVLKER